MCFQTNFLILPTSKNKNIIEADKNDLVILSEKHIPLQKGFLLYFLFYCYMAEDKNKRTKIYEEGRVFVESSEFVIKTL